MKGFIKVTDASTGSSLQLNVHWICSVLPVGIKIPYYVEREVPETYNTLIKMGASSLRMDSEYTILETYDEVCRLIEAALE